MGVEEIESYFDEYFEEHFGTLEKAAPTLRSKTIRRKMYST